MDWHYTHITEDLEEVTTGTVVMHVKRVVNSFVVILVLHLFIYNASKLFLKHQIIIHFILSAHTFYSDPPLEETDLPRGLWNCHSCRVRKVSHLFKRT